MQRLLMILIVTLSFNTFNLAQEKTINLKLANSTFSPDWRDYPYRSFGLFTLKTDKDGIISSVSPASSAQFFRGTRKIIRTGNKIEITWEKIKTKAGESNPKIPDIDYGKVLLVITWDDKTVSLYDPDIETDEDMGEFVADEKKISIYGQSITLKKAKGVFYNLRSITTLGAGKLSFLSNNEQCACGDMYEQGDLIIYGIGGKNISDSDYELAKKFLRPTYHFEQNGSSIRISPYLGDVDSDRTYFLLSGGQISPNDVADTYSEVSGDSLHSDKLLINMINYYILATLSENTSDNVNLGFFLSPLLFLPDQEFKASLQANNLKTNK